MVQREKQTETKHPERNEETRNTLCDISYGNNNGDWCSHFFLLYLFEKAIKKKYGGMLPKKPPLISKDHECAYFDSADWALGKQGAQKPKGPLEALRPM